METRIFGRTGMAVSALGFGCGAVGGLMVRGDAAEQERTVARALEAGVNYFDTAASYGDGASETNLGRVLTKLRPATAIVGTKVRLTAAEIPRAGDAIVRSLEASLQRLGRDHVDIFHLHNSVTVAGGGETISPRQVAELVVPALVRMREQGKTRFVGMTATGDTAALHQVIDSAAFDAAQVVFNMLNPSAAASLPEGYPAQDYRGLFARTQAAGTGVIGIRVLAGGALSGSAERHPVASPAPEPIGSAIQYESDLRRAARLQPLVEEGHAATLAEASVRFALSNPAIGTVLVGMATGGQFDAALDAVRKGPLPTAALERLVALRQGFVGEAR